jgi:hypothetical protein
MFSVNRRVSKFVAVIVITTATWSVASPSSLATSDAAVAAYTFGGDWFDRAADVAVDASGNIIMVGTFSGTADLDPGAGTASRTGVSPDQDIFVSKSSASGDLIWVKTFGDSLGNNPQAESVAVDASGNVHVTGYFGGPIDFDPGVGTTILNPAAEGIPTAFVLKLTAAGDLAWAKPLGGGGGTRGLSIAVDSAGNVISGGWFRGDCCAPPADFDPGAGETGLIFASGFRDGYVSKLDSNGNFVLVKRFTSAGDDVVTGVTVDASGNFYVTGGFDDEMYFMEYLASGGTLENSGTGLAPCRGSCSFVAKYGSSGSFQRVAHFVGDSGLTSQDVAVDSSGSVYVTGSMSGGADFNFDISVGFTATVVSTGERDVFVTKLDSSGNYVWAKAFGSVPSDDEGKRIAVDASGGVFITGTYASAGDFDPGAGTSLLGHSPNCCGMWDNDDIFAMGLNSSDGTFQWAHGFGGTYADNAGGVAVSGSGLVYVTGGFTATVDFDSGAGTVERSSTTNAFTSDAFIASYPTEAASESPPPSSGGVAAAEPSTDSTVAPTQEDPRDPRRRPISPNQPGFDAGAIRVEDVPAFEPSQLRSINASQVNRLTPEVVGALSPQQLAAIPPSALGSLRATQMSAMSIGSVAALRPAQMVRIPPRAMAVITPEQVSALRPAVVAALRPSQIAVMQPSSMAALQPAQVAALNRGVIEFLNPAQVAAIPPSGFAAMTPLQVGALSAAQVRSMSPEQAAALTPRQMRDLPASIRRIVEKSAARATGLDSLSRRWSVSSLT